MFERHLLIALLGLVILLTPFVTVADQVQSDAADVRVLIDISGSMKRNDPDNLRRPALRLLVGLLPGDSRAGVWTFGQYVNMQVPLGKVDEAWKQRATKGAAKIHSRGLFTNIEEVLKRSSADWQGKESGHRRHMVLLTDGMVDVSKDASLNAASRSRILSESLPRLIDLGVKVHTIALSERADHELMRTLSKETGGWYEQVDDAAQLQRVFLRVFEKVGKPDALPLKDNRFQVDDSVREATLLVFRDEKGQPTQVTSPSGQSFSSDNVPSNVKWHRDEGYDLVTITEPEVGDWRIDAALDPDNRVLVVTDLKMHVSDIPGQIIVGDPVPVSIEFSNQGERIVKRTFLDLVNLQSELTDSLGPTEPKPIYDDGQGDDEESGDGRYTLVIGRKLSSGDAELIISAQGKTFQRVQHQIFKMIPPVGLETRFDDPDSNVFTVQITPYAELLDTGSVKTQAKLVSSSGGEEKPVMFVPSADGTGWETDIDPSVLEGEWELWLNITATGLKGNRMVIDLDPMEISGLAEPVPKPGSEEPEGSDSEWLMQAAVVGAANLTLLLFAGLGFWIVKRRNSGEPPQILA
ncbi:MAG: VWA domain-containing protein [Gammaproteobacteria bacterium]|nr:VWA domain-containing protein [Gammaproteobacteria bacterium]